MSTSLRVLVADDEPLLVEELTAELSDLGHFVVETAATGTELVQKSKQVKPDLVVTDIKMPDMDGLEAARRICELSPLPFIIVSAYHDEEFIIRAMEQCVMSYLIKPITEGSLETAIALTMRRFREFEVLQNDNANLKQTLADRKLIERAKGLIMKRAGLDEQGAFLRLQSTARKKATPMVEVAKTILSAEEAFDG